MKTQAINILLPAELINAIDQQAQKEYRSRSEFIREAVRQKLKNSAEWENVFAQGKKLGKKMNITSEEEATTAAVQAVREVRQTVQE